MSAYNKIIFANASANADWFSQGLTDYAAGYSTGKIEELLNFIAPEVKVSPAFEYYTSGSGDIKYDETEAFYDDDNTMRMRHSGFRVVNTTGNTVTAKCNVYGLTTIVDDDDDFIQKQAVEELKKQLLREDLIRASKLFTSMVTPTNKVWKSGGENNPIKDIKELIASVGDDCGCAANKVLFGAAAWNMRAEYFGTDSPNYTISPDALALALGVDGIAIANERALMKQDGKEAQKRAYILPENNVYAFCSQGGASAQDFSVIKRFVATPFTVYAREIAGGLEISLYTRALIAQTGVGGMKALKVSDK